LQSSLVRDLEWVISSPPIIQGIHQQKNWTESNFWLNESRNFTGQYQRLDANPDILNELLQQQHDHRLGHHFETLLAYWFQHNKRYQILAQNLQVNQGNKTIGEFDFIIQDTLSNKTQHWEVACKFYLGLGNTQYRTHWLGPMLKDRLNIKFKSMQQRQSALSEQPAAKQLLQQLNISIDERICLMKGRLFYPIKQTSSPSPNKATNNHQRGWWARPDEFLAHFKNKALRWRPLKKNQWFAPQQNKYSDINHCTEELLHYFLNEHQQRPLCIAGFSLDESPSSELERGFLVAKDWASNVNIVDNSHSN